MDLPDGQEKYIELEKIHECKKCGTVDFRIIKQSHRKGDFGVNNWCFKCKNGHKLKSVDCPDNSFFNNTQLLHVRGCDRSRDNDTITCTSDEWRIIQECVAEYNEHFKVKSLWDSAEWSVSKDRKGDVNINVNGSVIATIKKDGMHLYSNAYSHFKHLGVSTIAFSDCDSNRILIKEYDSGNYM